MCKIIFKKVNLCFILFLLTSSIGCDAITDDRPIHKASEKGNLKRVKKIIDDDPTQVNIQNRLGWTPLYLASIKGHTEIVEFLLARNADIELGNDMNERPLEKAAKFGHYDVVKTLLVHGATVNCKNDFGQIPLHWAVRGDNKEVVDILLLHGADIFAKNSNNQTPKEVALKHGRKKLAQYLQTKE